MRKILRYEISMIFINKTYLIILGVLLLFFVVYLFYYNTLFTNVIQTGNYDKFELLSNYKQIITSNIFKLENEQLQFFQIKDINEQNRLYQFYIDTQTVEYNYINILNIESKINVIKNSGFFISFMNIIKYPITMFPVFVSAILFANDLESNNMKNLFQSDFSRKDFFMVKHIVGLFHITCISFIFFFIGLIFILSENYGQLILIDMNGKYYSNTILQIYLCQFISIYIFLLLTYEFSILIGLITRKGFLTFLIIIFSYLIVCCVYIAFIQLNLVDTGLADMKFFPICNILEYGKYGFSTTIIIYIFTVYVIASIILFLFNYKKFCRLDAAK